MAHEDGLITKPVNTSDVCSTIGEDKHRIGYLCVSENINIYSKHKPMRVATLAELTNAEKINVNWGYHVPAEMRMNAACQQMMLEDSGGTVTESDWIPSSDEQPYVYLKYGWWYRRPKGGETSPYRLGDFNNYNHNTEASVFRTSDIPTIISGAFDVDLSGTININDVNDVGTNTDPSSIGSLRNKAFVVGIVKSGDSYANLKFKSAPHTLEGTTYWTIVHFTDSDITKIMGESTTSGTYYMYFMLIERNGNTYSQNFDSTETATYAALTSKSKCIPLPLERVQFTYQKAAPVNPIGDLVFTFASGGSITYDSTHRRFSVTLPQLTARNTGSSQVTMTKDYLYMSVYLQKINDSSKRWESTKYVMGLTGTTTVNVNSTATVFSSASGTISDTSIVEFLGSDSINDYAKSAIVYYYINGIYYDVKALSL